MLISHHIHNKFRQNIDDFCQIDPHLNALDKLTYPYQPPWCETFQVETPGIYIITGGRQVGKSTACKLLIKRCLIDQLFAAHLIFYLACDEIYEAQSLSKMIRAFIDETNGQAFLLVIDEITYVKHWDRVIKAIADEGHFNQGTCLLTGSDSLVLKEAAMSFPGRRGKAANTDFHFYPLNFKEYTQLLNIDPANTTQLVNAFNDYLLTGGYLRAINDVADIGEIRPATYQTYEQWILGDFIKHGKNVDYLLHILHALLTIGISQVSYSTLTQKIGLISKDTCIDYCHLLERMDVLFNLQAFDLNKKQGFPRKARKFHFIDPFIKTTIIRWLNNAGYTGIQDNTSFTVESIVASHCYRQMPCYYYKGTGEIDLIYMHKQNIHAVEVKWANQIRPNDLKMLRQFKHSLIVTKQHNPGMIESIATKPVVNYLLDQAN